MYKNKINSRSVRVTAAFLMVALGFQIGFPGYSYALTSGPVQPEVRGFEPVGTSDMIDMFTGDFVYNIPLLDVDGYPINISYHSGIDMEAEASWVGLGWSLTPGAVNKSVRGLPDDFSGEKIEKEVYIKPEKTIRVGGDVGVELFNIGSPLISLGASVGTALSMSNYKGVSLDFTAGLIANAGYNVGSTSIGVGANAGVSLGSQTGAAINYGANIGFGIKNAMNSSLGMNFNANASGIYSTRTGLHNQVGIGGGVSLSDLAPRSENNKYGFGRIGFNTGVSIPIGLQNYTAVISNASHTEMMMGRIKAGLELFGVIGSLSVFGSLTTTSFESNGTRDAYGYFNLEKGNQSSLADFSREKDGFFNSTLHYLPFSTLTYDVYNLSGQGTGGSFRPYRNDIGSVNDPSMQSSSSSESLELEGGLGNLVEVGGDYSSVQTSTHSGAWPHYTKNFDKTEEKGSFERITFKEAGELTYSDADFYNNIGGSSPITPEAAINFSQVKSSANKRLPRANYIYAVSADNKDEIHLLDKRIVSYNDTTGYSNFPDVPKSFIPRVDNSGAGKRANHITEIIQQQKDGRRYIYGIPVQNNIQREVVFAVNDPDDQTKNSRIYTINAGDVQPRNGSGRDEFYQSTITPSYTTSYLLTGVLSNDYSDLTGDGISDDDLGGFTKFNYTRKSKDYRWRAPYDPATAQYNAGYISDKRDDKASYIAGSREQWYLHSVESKNQVAVFYTSKRLDGKGVTAPIAQSAHGYGGGAALQDQFSYKLDSIALYNKQDKIINGKSAQPLKVVYFSYDYSLCPKVSNNEVSNQSTSNGKLTLKSIRIKEGTSNVSLLNPYEFTYNNINPEYDPAAKDRWGYYKDTMGVMTNYEFPFVSQTPSTNHNAAAWCLSDINLPSSARISVNYESDDYAYVQDKKAMEMFLVRGTGNSPSFSPRSILYANKSQPFNYLYFDRDKSREIYSSAKENYLPETDLLYFNAYVNMNTNGSQECIKGYAHVEEIGYCDDTHGYIKIQPEGIQNGTINPITLAALNLGRYALNHILFPGSDPDKSDLENIVAGLEGALQEFINIADNPLNNLMDDGAAQNIDLNKSFVRLGSPGLRKKGGGCRVQKITFSDNWNQMAGGYGALYGKEYSYTTLDKDSNIISSGVASYEPQIGGDELPQREPVRYTVQQGGSFPPHDPVELYQETPIGESFFPSPVVGYSRVMAKSIHQENARSAQYEDIYTFYTAKEFPFQVSTTPIQTTPGTPKVTTNSVDINQESTQGAAIVLNDMHGKQKGTEHYTLLPAINSRELNTWVKHDYLQNGNQLRNSAPVYEYDAHNGQINANERMLGIDADITLDSREHEENTTTTTAIASGFVSVIPMIPPIFYGWGVGYVWDKQNNSRFRMAAATKIVQQYGIPHKITQNIDGAITVKTNEIWDPITGMPVVTSINNAFLDSEYTVNYPAYWAYKELGPTYLDRNKTGSWSSAVVGPLGNLSARFTNWNPGLPGLVESQHYPLLPGTPVITVNLNDGIGDFTLGDELLVWQGNNSSAAIRVWVVGYSADENAQQYNPQCYLILTTREPWKAASWPWATTGTNLSNINYRILRPGKRNRLSETVQTVVTTKRSDVMPVLKDSFGALVNLQASTMHHALTLPTPRLTDSAYLNPFVSLMAGQYRPEKTVINLKNRRYDGLKTRTSGLYNSKAYWKTFKPEGPYCLNKLYCNVPVATTYAVGYGDDTAISTHLYINPALTAPVISTSTHYRTEIYCDGIKVRDTIAPVNLNSVNYIQFKMYDMMSHTPSYNAEVIQYPCTVTGQRVISEACQVKSLLTILPQYPTVNQPNGVPTRVGKHDKATILENGYDLNLPDSYQWWIGHPHLANPSMQRIAEINMVSNRIHFNYLTNSQPEASPENWTTLKQTTLYDIAGNELEEYIPEIGYNCAVYGYNATLPTLVAKNARYGKALFEGFEDYLLYKPVDNNQLDYLRYAYSPFAQFWVDDSMAYNLYHKSKLASNTPVQLSTEAHTGHYSLEITQDTSIDLVPGATASTSFRSFSSGDPENVLRFWAKQKDAPQGTLAYSLSAEVASTTNGHGITKAAEPITNIIEGWQQFEVRFRGSANNQSGRIVTLHLPAGFYYDDFKIVPTDANGKGFVYNPFNNKLTATLDENNFATFYEYDAAGNLIRTKKETERGIITLTESRTQSAKQP